MSTMLVVPAGFVRYLRHGLFSEWGFVAEDISTLASACGSKATKRQFDELRQAFDAGCAYLDTIGWCDVSSQGDVEIDLGLRPMMVIKALEGEHESLADHLTEIPMDKVNHDAVSARVEELREFVKTARKHAREFSRSQAKTDSTPAVSKPETHRNRSSRAGPSQH
jgi:hypothetical protein